MLPPGGVIEFTQASVNIENLIGQFNDGRLQTAMDQVLSHFEPNKTGSNDHRGVGLGNDVLHAVRILQVA